MEINKENTKLIVHIIKKEQHKTDVSIERGKEILFDQEPLNLLIDNINNSFSNEGLKYGKFNQDEPQVIIKHSFEFYLNSFLKEEDYTFSEFTYDVTSNLKKILENISAAKGGILFFMLYEDKSEKYLVVKIIRQISGFELNQNTIEYKNNHLELSKLYVGVRIKINKYLDKNSKINYLSFKQKDNEKINYFDNFIGCSKQNTSADDTKSLLRTINNFIKTNNLEDRNVSLFAVNKMHKYLDSKDENTPHFSVKKLSQLIGIEYNLDSNLFINFYNTKNLNGEIEISRRVLKNNEEIKNTNKDLNITVKKSIVIEKLTLTKSELKIPLDELNNNFIEEIRNIKKLKDNEE